MKSHQMVMFFHLFFSLVISTHYNISSEAFPPTSPKYNEINYIIQNIYNNIWKHNIVQGTPKRNRVVSA